MFQEQLQVQSTIAQVCIRLFLPSGCPEEETPECLTQNEDFIVCVSNMTCSEVEELANNPINNTEYACAEEEDEYLMCALEAMLGDIEITIDD